MNRRFTFIKEKIWPDPVWSQVIAAGVISLIGLAGVFATSLWNKFEVYTWIVVCGFILLPFIVWFFCKRESNEYKLHHKKIFVIASNVENNLFFLSLVSYIPIVFNDNYDIVMKLIEDKEDTFDNVLNAILKNNTYAAGIIIPSSLADSKTASFKLKLHAFIRKFEKPLIIADWSKDQLDSSNKLTEVKNIYTIYFDNKIGGEKAGEVVINYYKNNNTLINIQIIGDGTQPNRAESFRNALKLYNKLYNKFMIADNIELNTSFSFDLATIIKTKIKEKLKNNSIDLIFCLNDTITLACLDVLDEQEFSGNKKPKVIGYDATIVTQRICNDSIKNDGHLINTICQDNKELVQKIKHIITDHIKGNGSNHAEYDIKLNPLSWI